MTVIGAVVVVRVLVSFPRFRRFAGHHLRRLWAWIVERLDPPDEIDELAEEMRLVLRGERLRADVRRVQRLLLTDTSMPATRQIGNRIAYDWLVRELDRYTLEVSGLITHDWNAAPDSLSSSRSWSTSYRPRTSQVEVLELGWRR